MGKKKDPLEGAEEQGTKLEDFVIEQKISAFIKTYQPCSAALSTKTF